MRLIPWEFQFLCHISQGIRNLRPKYVAAWFSESVLCCFTSHMDDFLYKLRICFRSSCCYELAKAQCTIVVYRFVFICCRASWAVSRIFQNIVCCSSLISSEVLIIAADWAVAINFQDFIFCSWHEFFFSAHSNVLVNSTTPTIDDRL